MHLSHHRFACSTRSPLRDLGCQLSVWPSPGTAKCPEPLCPRSALPAAARRRAPCPRALPPRLRSYGLMRQTKFLLPTSLTYFGRSWQVAVSPCWKMALPDVISAVCVKTPGPLPRRVPADYIRLRVPPLRSRRKESQDIGHALESTSMARRETPCNAISAGRGISGLQSFANVQAPPLARPPDCTHRCVLRRAAGPFTSRNEHGVTRLDRSRFSMNRDIATYLKRIN